MPDASTYSGIPVPTGPEAGDVPGSLSALRAALDPQVVLKATSVSDRDTRLSGIPAGTLVSCEALGTLWQKKATSGFRTLAEVGTVVTTGVVSASPNFSITSQWAQRVNGMITISAILGYTGTTVTAGGNSDLSPDVSVCTIQSTFLPPASLLSNGVWPSMTLNAMTGQGYIDSGGVVRLGSLTPGQSLSSGLSVRFTATYPGA